MRYVVPILLLLLVGCGDDKPKDAAAAPVTTVEQMIRNISARLDTQKAAAEKLELAKAVAADKARFVAVLQGPLDQWNERFYRINGGTLREMIELGKQMQASRNEMTAVPTTTCTAVPRDTIVAGMDIVLAIIAGIEASKGEAVPADISTSFSTADQTIRQGAVALAACLK
jgi:uncharacterized protein YcfL